MDEHRFRRPDGFEWVTIGTPTQADIDAYPEGTVEIAMVPIDPQPDPVPSSISDRQFFQYIADPLGWITHDEALAAVMTGTLPAAFETFIEALPEDQRFPARMQLSGATSFERASFFVYEFAAMRGLTSDETDNIWREAAKV